MPVVSHEILQILAPLLSTSSMLRDTDPYGLPGPLASGREMGEKEKETRVSVYMSLAPSQQGQHGLVCPLVISQLILAPLFPVPVTTPPTPQLLSVLRVLGWLLISYCPLMFPFTIPSCKIIPSNYL